MAGDWYVAVGERSEFNLNGQGPIELKLGKSGVGDMKLPIF